jgi:5,5'-dehydrodivanillate O-demethylase oxygenase subunit
MLTQEANDRLTRVGPGTPMGTLLRRYWFPVATASQLDKDPVLPVELLGEKLTLFRGPDGKMALLAERCPHRGTPLKYGMPEAGGLRCPYHGWKFDHAGQCVDQPAEPEDSTFCHKVKIAGYPAQELGGLVWAYLGPEPAPLLPRYDLYVREDLDREIGITRLPCNWLQVMENSLDPVHLEYLHGMFLNYAQQRLGKPASAAVRHHLKIDFDVFEFGIAKRRLLEGQSEDCDDWRVGHPILFPNVLAVGDESGTPEFQVRVPVNDTETLHFWYVTDHRQPGAPPQTTIPVYDYPYQEEDGRIIVETIRGQDMFVWLGQGAIADRSVERLGTSDKGIILYRKLLEEQMAKVERGEDPMAVVRDPAKNFPMIPIPREGKAHYVVGEFVQDDDGETLTKKRELAGARA